MLKRGDFEYIPRYCIHCGKQIPLKKEYFSYYEAGHYPKYIARHEHIGKPRPEEVKKKISEAQFGEKNHRWGKPAWNKNISMPEKQKEKISEGLKKYYQQQEPVVEAPKNEYLQKSRMDILLEKQAKKKKIPEKVIEIPIIKPLPSMVPVNENSSLTKKFEKIIEKMK